MIVVVNPSSASGHSFKGLHAYCAHDQDRAETSERVDWIESRNIATDDPAQAWKVMVATAQAQNDLKRSAGVSAGRRSKSGPVLHVVLSFDRDEPKDKDSMQNAADEFLSQLGVNPAKMRGKNKPKRRQFADEHQVMMYAHSDTDNHHLHLMINTVHPEHGVKLPTNNNWNKAQDWALEYSKKMGTDHKTPARSENKADRKNGEYVKGPKRMARNLYELDKALEAVNDNERFKQLRAQQTKKDAALALRGRNMAKMQSAAWDRLANGHESRKSALARQLQTQINKTKAAVREKFRPAWRELDKRQKAERQTFEGLESSFFGRASNVFRTVRLSAKLVREDKSGIITRSFRILTNAAQRKAYFEKAQDRHRTTLQRRQTAARSEGVKLLKVSQAQKLAQNRAVFLKGRESLAKSHEAAHQQLKADWKTRTTERDAVLKAFAAKQPERDELKAAQRKAAGKTHLDPRERSILDSYSKTAFDRARRSPAREQDNLRDRDKDEDRER